MRQTKDVGPYQVKALTVREGLKLMASASKVDGGNSTDDLQTELILACVSKDGQPVGDGDFGEMVPHLAELVTTAVELNGFGNK